MMRKEWYQTLVIETTGSGPEMTRIRNLLSEYEVEIRDLDIKESEHADRLRLELQVKLVPDQPRDEIITQLRRLERTVEAYWI